MTEALDPDRPPQEQLLFDLPLEPAPRKRRRRAAGPVEVAAAEPSAVVPPASLALHVAPRERDERAAESLAARSPPRVAPAVTPVSPQPSIESLPGPQRLPAALWDLAVHAALMLLVWAGMGLLGIPLATASWLPVALFLAAFSVVYSVVPVALWGQTPGMAACGLRVCGGDGRPPSFGGAGRRWGAGVITAALGGLPGLLLDPPLTDRLSATHVARVR